MKLEMQNSAVRSSLGANGKICRHNRAYCHKKLLDVNPSKVYDLR